MTADEPVAGVPRLCARRADCTRPRGHDDECGPDRDQTRVARYAAALSSARLDAVLAVADTELAEARADVERLMEVAEVLVAQVADRLAERDALQRQVDAVMPYVVRARRWIGNCVAPEKVAPGAKQAMLDALAAFAALDAVEPADQPTVPVVTDDPDGFFTPVSDGEAWAVEPADQPHPTPEAAYICRHGEIDHGCDDDLDHKREAGS